MKDNVDYKNRIGVAAPSFYIHDPGWYPTDNYIEFITPKWEKLGIQDCKLSLYGICLRIFYTSTLEKNKKSVGPKQTNILATCQVILTVFTIITAFPDETRRWSQQV